MTVAMSFFVMMMTLMILMIVMAAGRLRIVFQISGQTGGYRLIGISGDSRQ